MIFQPALSKTEFLIIFFIGIFLMPIFSFSQTGESVSKVSKKSNLWSGNFVLDISRATDINHSKILNAENPERRTDYSLAAILTGAYKKNINRFYISQVATQDVIRNGRADEGSDWSIKNPRLGWTRQTQNTILNSNSIDLPFSIVVPITDESRKFGSLGSFRFWPVVSWTVDEVLSVSYSFQSVFAFTERSDQNGVLEETLKNSTLLLNNTLIFSFYLNKFLSLSQSFGISSLSKGLDKPLDMDQSGSSFSMSSGISITANSNLFFDLSVSQSSPMQGDGLGATRVYENNFFRPYHSAQSTYGFTTTYTF